MFYYLNEPKFGGETAFPIADNETIPENEVRHETQAAMLYDEHLVLQLLSANCGDIPFPYVYLAYLSTVRLS